MDEKIENIEQGFVQGELVSLGDDKSKIIETLTNLLVSTRQLDINDLEDAARKKLKELVNSIKPEDY